MAHRKVPWMNRGKEGRREGGREGGREGEEEGT
jgi:hypothetical protein